MYIYIYIYTHVYIYIYISFFSPSPWFLVSALDARFSAQALERLAGRLAGAQALRRLQRTAGAPPRSVGRAAYAATPRRGPGRRSGSAASRGPAPNTTTIS